VRSIEEKLPGNSDRSVLRRYRRQQFMVEEVGPKVGYNLSNDGAAKRDFSICLLLVCVRIVPAGLRWRGPFHEIDMDIVLGGCRLMTIDVLSGAYVRSVRIIHKGNNLNLVAFSDRLPPSGAQVARGQLTAILRQMLYTIWRESVRPKGNTSILCLLLQGHEVLES
jgi:hypothetical protein